MPRVNFRFAAFIVFVVLHSSQFVAVLSAEYFQNDAASGQPKSSSEKSKYSPANVKVASLNIQRAIAQCNEGKAAAQKLQQTFAPRRADLEKQQKAIAELQARLKSQEPTLSADARAKLLRTIEEKVQAFRHSDEDATKEFERAEQDAIDEIGRKMMATIVEYAPKNGYNLVLDSSSRATSNSGKAYDSIDSRNLVMDSPSPPPPPSNSPKKSDIVLYTAADVDPAKYTYLPPGATDITDAIIKSFNGTEAKSKKKR